MRAIEAAEQQGLRPGLVPLGHLELAVLWSLELEDEADDAVACTWSARVAHRHGSSILTDFVWSLACESKPEWRVPEYSEEGSVEALRIVIERVHPLASKRDRIDQAVEGFVAEALDRVHEAYWSERARSRFRGRCAIWSLVGLTAHRLLLAERERSAASVELDSEAPTPPTHDHVELEELKQAISVCLEQMPRVRQLVTRRAVLDGVSPSRIADELGIGRSAVSNHLTHARGDIRKHLLHNGFRGLLEEWGFSGMNSHGS